MWKNKNVLVTGSGGFIGSHLTEELVKLGANLTCIVRYNSRNDWGLLELLPKETKDKIKVILGDITDVDFVKKVSENTDVIFHLAALISIPYSYVSPRSFIETNILGTYNILTSANENSVKRIVHTSTSEAYGTAKYVPIDENHPLQGQSPYSASKIGADKIAESFYHSFNLPVSTVRPFNTYGPRQSARAIIPTIITQALTKENIKLGILNSTRDLTFVKDTVRGFIKIAESKESIGKVINIGSGKEISMGELAEKIISLMGINKEIISEQKRLRPEKSEVLRLNADISKAKKLLGWEPKISLEQGLKLTIDYIKKNIGRYKANFYNI